MAGYLSSFVEDDTFFLHHAELPEHCRENGQSDFIIFSGILINNTINMINLHCSFQMSGKSLRVTNGS